MLRLITAILMILYMSTTYAWNYTGHVLVAQIAYDNLSPEKKIEANKLATNIFDMLPPNVQEKLNRQYPNAETFAKVAILPDVWRKWKLITLFNHFNASLPLNLFLSSQRSTASWHFIDTPYPRSSFCGNIESQNIVWALQKLEPDLRKENNVNTKALLMILVEHYIADSHQPMHTLTNVNKLGCRGDRGGNDYCLKSNKDGKCTKTLHALWDSGVGYLKSHENIQQLSYEIQKNYPSAQFATQINDENQLNWVNNGYKNAAFIYSTPEYMKPSPNYYRDGQSIAKSQIALAGYRLAKEINNDL